MRSASSGLPTASLSSSLSLFVSSVSITGRFMKGEMTSGVAASGRLSSSCVCTISMRSKYAVEGGTTVSDWSSGVLSSTECRELPESRGTKSGVVCPEDASMPVSGIVVFGEAEYDAVGIKSALDVQSTILEGGIGKLVTKLNPESDSSRLCLFELLICDDS